MLYVFRTVPCVIVVLICSQKHALYYSWSAGTTATAVVQMLTVSEVLDVKPPTPHRLVNKFAA